MCFLTRYLKLDRYCAHQTTLLLVGYFFQTQVLLVISGRTSLLESGAGFRINPFKGSMGCRIVSVCDLKKCLFCLIYPKSFLQLILR